MVSDNYVPIIQITDENFKTMWPAISQAIIESSFVALDCELSGLGTRSKLNSPEIDFRYINVKEITQEYSIVSLGISCFKCQFCSQLNASCVDGKNSVKSHSYLVQTFNILTFCTPRYIVEMRSLKFLLSHGFDFNKQYAHGLQYERGEDQEIGDANSPLSVKNIFHLIIKYEKPIVLHNGFVDLMFLYQSFYTELPKNIENFAADLLEMFPSGIYDTKYISEYHQSFPATYLEFVFKYLQIENVDRLNQGNWHCRFKFLPYPQDMTNLKWHYYLQVFDESLSKEEQSRPLCVSYKFHGWCSEGERCNSSHNINRIVRELKQWSSKKRKFGNGVAGMSLAQLINIKIQKIEEEKANLSAAEEKANLSAAQAHSLDDKVSIDKLNIGESSFQNSSHCEENNEKHSLEEKISIECHVHSFNSDGVSTNNSPSDLCKGGNSMNGTKSDAEQNENIVGKKSNHCSGHSAGFDAFMTGYIFAYDIATLGVLPNILSFKDPKELKLHHMVGKVYLIGKEFPFLVRSSSYHSTSPNHDKLIKILRNR